MKELLHSPATQPEDPLPGGQGVEGLPVGHVQALVVPWGLRGCIWVNVHGFKGTAACCWICCLQHQMIAFTPLGRQGNALSIFGLIRQEARGSCPLRRSSGKFNARLMQGIEEV